MNMAKAIADPNGMKKCPVCRKDFFVQWQSLWAYKRGEGPRTKYICSWKCLRAFDKKEEDKHVGKPRVISQENEAEAIKCAIAGGDPLTFLANCGSKNPSACWYYIRQKVHDSDPDTFAKLPKKLPARTKKIETPEGTLADAVKGMQDAADKFFVQYCPDHDHEYLTDEEAKRLAGAGKICKPLMHSGLTASAWKGLFGRYSYDDKHDMIDYEGNDGEELSMKVESWQKFIGELKLAASLLGVEL